MKTKILLGVAGLSMLASTISVAPAFGSPVVRARAVRTPAVRAVVRTPAVRTPAIRVPSVRAAVVHAPRASVPVVAGVARIRTVTTVVTLNPTVGSGRPAKFMAQVEPVSVGTAKISGTVFWLIINRYGRHVPCTHISAFRRSGESICKIGGGVLRGAGSPLSVLATYSGDSSFKGSSGTATERVIAQSTRMKINIPVAPTNGAPTLVEAQTLAGPGTPMIVGHITFIIISGATRRGVSANCKGSASPATANNTKPVVGGLATCRLPAGWMVIPTAPGTQPITKWSITATYDGTGSFGLSTATRRGTVRG